VSTTTPRSWPSLAPGGHFAPADQQEREVALLRLALGLSAGEITVR
jgi:hypothetical protein